MTELRVAPAETEKAGPALLLKRRFGPLFVVQFLGAFNDNLMKFAMLFFASFTIFRHDGTTAGMFATIATGVFILPYFLFSALAGELADRIDKARLVRFVKGAEVGIMLVTAVGFALASVWVMLAALFLMGCHSATFGPAKYAILPQYLARGEIMEGTGLVEAGTFVAILGGQLFAGLVPPDVAVATMLAVAGAGFAASLLLPPAPPMAVDRPRLNLWRSSVRVLALAWRDERLWYPILGVSWFFAAGAVLLSVFVPLVAGVFRAGADVATGFLLVFSLGVAFGALAISRILKGRISPRYTALAAMLMAIGLAGAGLVAASYRPTVEGIGFLTFVATLPGAGTLFFLFLVAVSGGAFIVPLYALLQTAGVAGERSRVIAANNILNAAVTVALVAAATFALGRGASIPMLLVGLGAGTLLFGVTIGRRIAGFTGC